MNTRLDSLSATPARAGLLSWWFAVGQTAQRALIAAAFGWMLDAFDIMLFSMVLSSLIASLGLSKIEAGLLGSAALLSSAAGGIVFGFIADRFGRTRALMASVLVYSVFTGMCGLAQTVGQLAICRVLLGFGMGGEWASGAALISETWPAEHRGKAFGVMQSMWAVGYGAAALVTALVLPRWGWRAVFFVGVLPAFFTLWVRSKVEEPQMWRDARARGRRGSRALTGVRHAFAQMFSGRLAGITVAVTAMNAATLFGWWGLNLWLPGYLSLPVDDGGIGLSTYAMSGLVLAMQVGMWFGYITFGFIGDAFGRKRAYLAYLLLAALLLPLYGAIRHPLILLVMGPIVAFFGTGYFSGFGALTAEIYPTEIRATAQGFTYNMGRIASALAPLAVGSLAQSQGFGLAFGMTGAAFLFAAVTWRWIPDTTGRALT